jgi:hypothetical protein
MSRWGDVFAGDVVAAAMIDRLVHCADVVALKGNSYRLKSDTSDYAPRPPRVHDTNRRGVALSRSARPAVPQPACTVHGAVDVNRTGIFKFGNKQDPPDGAY